MNLIDSLMAAMLVIGAITTFDFLVYTVKSAPKSSNFGNLVWFIGGILGAVAVQWFWGI